MLEALGIDVELSAERVAECIETTGVGFMFAPVVHPAMRVRDAALWCLCLVCGC